MLGFYALYTILLAFCSLKDLRKALELLLFLNPDDQESRLLYTRILVHLGINLEEVSSV